MTSKKQIENSELAAKLAERTSCYQIKEFGGFICHVIFSGQRTEIYMAKRKSMKEPNEKETCVQ